MKQPIQVEFLKDHPQFMNEVAGLWHKEWGRLGDAADAGRKLQSVQAKMGKDKVPFILIATQGGMLVGTASAFANDLDNRPDLTPWLAAVVTKDQFRGLGVAEKLTNAVMAECRSLGYERMYLRTEKADKYFTRFGWSLITDTMGEDGSATRIYEMRLVDS